MKQTCKRVWKKAVCSIGLMAMVLSTVIAPPTPAVAGADPFIGFLSAAGGKLAEEAIDRLFDLVAGLFKDKDVYFSKADPYLFFEGNNCTQQLVGSMWTTDMNVPGEPTAWNVKTVSWFENDEARSVFIRQAKAGEVLRVYDSPGGSTGDDWAEITILRDLPEPYCIGSFELSRRIDDFVEIVWAKHNGLDGKISRVENGRLPRFNSRTFLAPQHQGYRIDLCLLEGEACGMPAADVWCHQRGYQRAIRWTVAPDIGAQSPTIMLGSGQICNQWYCDSFTTLTCGTVGIPLPPSSDE